MPFHLIYEFRMPYQVLPFLGAQPAVNVQLEFGNQKTQTVGILDSGSVLTVFDEEVARRLGIENIAEGRPIRGTSLGGPFQLYLFDVNMTLLANGRMTRFPAQVGFRPGYQNRNILGRNLVFSYFQVGFHEREQEVYLQPQE